MHPQARYFLAVSAILAFVVLGLTNCTAQREGIDLSGEAWTFITLSVKDRLGNTSLTTFPPNGAQGVTSLGDNRYQVTSYVDFKRGQGDVQRTYFYGTVVQKEGSWSVESIKLSE